MRLRAAASSSSAITPGALTVPPAPGMSLGAAAMTGRPIAPAVAGPSTRPEAASTTRPCDVGAVATARSGTILIVSVLGNDRSTNAVCTRGRLATAAAIAAGLIDSMLVLPVVAKTVLRTAPATLPPPVPTTTTRSTPNDPVASIARNPTRPNPTTMPAASSPSGTNAARRAPNGETRSSDHGTCIGV